MYTEQVLALFVFLSRIFANFAKKTTWLNVNASSVRLAPFYVRTTKHLTLFS